MFSLYIELDVVDETITTVCKYSFSNLQNFRRLTMAWNNILRVYIFNKNFVFSIIKYLIIYHFVFCLWIITNRFKQTNWQMLKYPSPLKYTHNKKKQFYNTLLLNYNYF